VATEQEALRLIVSLDAERAKAELRQLQEQMKSLGTGAQAAGQERLIRGLRETTQGLSKMGGELGGIATRLGLLAPVVGTIGATIAVKAVEAGADLLKASTDFKAFSAVGGRLALRNGGGAD
jgi:hypothetical protein